MNTIWQSTTFAPTYVVKRYVNAIGQGFKVYEVNSKSRTIRELSAERWELPPEIASAAEAKTGIAFGAVEWPIV